MTDEQKDQTDRELIARIDERVESLCKTLDRFDKRMFRLEGIVIFEMLMLLVSIALVYL